MTSRVTHPLVSAYLRDLEILLAGVEPGERAEVLSGVHEHLHATLPPGSSDEDVHRTLGELGSPQSVADEAYAGRPVPAAPLDPRPRPGLMSRRWVPVLAGILFSLALLLVVFVVAMGNGYGTSGVSTSDASGQVVTQEVVEFNLTPLGLVGSLLLTWPLWLPAAVIVGLSPLWTARQKWALHLLIPASAAVMWILPWLGWAITRAEIGINLGAWTSLIIGVIGGGYTLLRLCRNAIRRTEALENEAKP